MTMSTIYEPAGRAREYAPYALNGYTGCAHSCTYCYAPQVGHKTREQFAKPEIREGILGALEKYLEAKGAPDGYILLSFSCDGYQPMEEHVHLTRDIIQMLGEAGCKVRLLTKAPLRALRLDEDLFVKHNVDFGISLAFVNDALRAKYEPNAESVMERVNALYEAQRRGLSTWISIEPVLDPTQALNVINLGTHVLEGCVDRWMVGKLNHDAELEKKIDEEFGWGRFLQEALKILNLHGMTYYVKQDLWRCADATTETIFPRASQSILKLVDGKPDVDDNFPG
jgi:DNA repair photolyase